VLFLSCKANARVKPANSAMDLPTGLHDSLITEGRWGAPELRLFATKLIFTLTEMQLQQYNAAGKSNNFRQGIQPRLTIVSGH
jgi:hypothetical protein